MSYAEEVMADARLRLLQILAAKPLYTGNELSLKSELAKCYGHAFGRDLMRAQLVWLDEQGLLTIQQPGGMMLVTLSGRGSEVGCGLSRHPGVAQPRAGE